jgi:hypothetical protein
MRGKQARRPIMIKSIAEGKDRRMKPENTASRETVLFLGNGLNRLYAKVSFENLIDELCALTPGVEKGTKSFPLLYEEIYALYKSRTAVEQKAHQADTELLNKIAEWSKQINPGALHEKIWKKYRTVLTTNYDYALEDGMSWKNGGVREGRYSLFRKYSDTAGVTPRTVWHIHGEAAKPRTICLGYELYGGALQTMRNFLVAGKKNKHTEIETISRRIKNNAEHPAPCHAWLDYFFFSDIHIAGFNLTESEIDLWWLLSFRSRLKKNPDYKIDNTITYFDNTPETPDKETAQKKTDRRQLLKALDVKVKEENKESPEQSSGVF